jgi:hypothetical protein
MVIVVGYRLVRHRVLEYLAEALSFLSRCVILW